MSNIRPRLLISVRDECEAADAVAGGADWIDCKEPLNGPLGAIDVAVAERVIQTVGRMCPISAALGELVDWPRSRSRSLLNLEMVGVVKLGLSRCAGRDWESVWHSAFDAICNSGKQLAAVIYADWQAAVAPAPDKVLDCAIKANCRFLLIDTFCKASEGSFRLLPGGQLKAWLDLARRHGMTTVFAGGIKSGDLAKVVELPLDIIGIRGAACRHGREKQLELELVRELSSQLDQICLREKNLPTCLTSFD